MFYFRMKKKQWLGCGKNDGKKNGRLFVVMKMLEAGVAVDFGALRGRNPATRGTTEIWYLMPEREAVRQRGLIRQELVEQAKSLAVGDAGLTATPAGNKLREGLEGT